MKKIFSFILLVFIASTSFAQDKMYFNNVKGNRFGDNWDLSIGGGFNYSAYKGIGSNQGEFLNNTGWTVDVTGTKWFNPIIGARIQTEAGQVQARNSKSWFITPHVDGVINLSNWIGGYKNNRIYYANIFAGVGAHIVDIEYDANAGIVGVAGINNVFRVSPAIDINLELKAHVMECDEMQYVVKHYGKVGQVYSATVGVTYRFNKRYFVQAVPKIVADEYLALIEKMSDDFDKSRKMNHNMKNLIDKDRAIIAKLVKDHQDLTDKIKNHKCDVKAINPSFVFFDINSAKISDYGCVALNELAKNIKKSNDKFTIVGHADKATGTNEYNLKLSEKRAKAVYDYLVENGVNKDQLTWKGVGSSQNIFPINSTNRVVIVK